jgi:hypothetical protein
MTSIARTTRCSFLLGTLLLCTGPVLAQATQTTDAPRTVQQSVEATATISAIDKATRTLTLKLDDGSTTSIVAGPEVQRFDQLAVGDKVHARYTIAVTSELRAPTEEEKAEPFMAVEGGGRTPEGAAPGAGAGRVVRVVATIEALDRTTQTATLKGPKGNYMTVEVSDPSILLKPHLGDTVVVTVAESVALSVEKVPAAAAPATPAEPKPAK